MISVEGAPENNVREIHYDEKCIMRRYQLSTGRIISARERTNKTKDILVIARKRYKRRSRVGNFILLMNFSH